MNEDGRWITTKYGNKVFIKNKDVSDYMNNKIRNKKEKAKSIQFEETEPSKIGNFIKLTAKVNNKEVGYAKYRNQNDEIQVSYIFVEPDHRRKGIATQLYKQLQSKTPNKDIHFGELTEEGKKTVEKIGIITKKEIVPNLGGYNAIHYYGRIKK